MVSMMTNGLHETYRRLMILAEQAEARYSAVIKARTGLDRWTMTREQEAIPEIAEAYRAKVTADEAVCTFIRTTR
jgi:hypothetical protein